MGEKAMTAAAHDNSQPEDRPGDHKNEPGNSGLEERRTQNQGGSSAEGGEIIYRVSYEKHIDLVERLVRVEEAMVHIHELIKEQMRFIDKRFEQVDKRFEQVDKRFEQVDKRFEQVDKRFEALQHQMDKRFEAMQLQMDKRFDQVDKRFTQLQWLIGLGFGGISILMGVLNYL